MGAKCAPCCEGCGGAALGPADRDASLCRLVTLRWAGRRGSVPRLRGARVGRSAGLVVACTVRSCRVPSLGMLRGWVRASWKIVAADGKAWPSVFVTLRSL